jgi:molybdate transport system substrate-binding protein
MGVAADRNQRRRNPMTEIFPYRRVAAVGAVAVLSLLFGAFVPNAATAAEIRVLSSLGVKPAMVDLVPAFERLSGHKVIIDYGTIAALAARIQKGELADVVIVSNAQIDALERQGKIIAGSGANVAKTGVGLFARRGGAKPDVSSVDALQRTLLAAKSIGHADPARGGGIAIYVAGLLSRLDIAAEIRSKIRLFPPSDYAMVANGDIEIAFGGISEILVAPGVELVGPLPEAIQNYALITAGIVASSKEHEASKAFIQFISSPAAAESMRSRGFQSL